MLGHTSMGILTAAHLTGENPHSLFAGRSGCGTRHHATSLKNAAEKPPIDRVVASAETGVSMQRLESPSAYRGGRAESACGEGGNSARGIDRIQPAVEAARKEGIDVKGPISGDTVFYRALKGEFDLVVAQYHDQGHIPTKLIAFDTTVNVSLGLPIRRTSVDHGTAHDIAWTGKASNVNMNAAIAYARKMADRVAA